MPPSRRDELVDAAMRVFAHHGYHASGLERILQASGISRMTLYNHFKSKDDLILAALRRRDELVRGEMARFVEARGPGAEDRILAVFDFLERWFREPDFCGCMFINASAEFEDPAGAVRRIAADHKLEIIRFLRVMCQEAGCADAERAAEQLGLLIEGAIVSAHVIARAWETDPGAPARLAKEMAMWVLERGAATREAGVAADG